MSTETSPSSPSEGISRESHLKYSSLGVRILSVKLQAVRLVEVMLYVRSSHSIPQLVSSFSTQVLFIVPELNSER